MAPNGRPRRRVLAMAITITMGLLVVTLAATALVLVAGTPTTASTGWLAAPADLKQVIDNLRNWLVGMLVALATLALTIGGIRYLLASGDPGEVNRAKETLKYAAVGYAVAALAPVLVAILSKIVGA
jgi:hypothetical protein